LLDFTGGMLSDIQLFLDCINLKDFRLISRNLAKFGLGWLSVMFDLIFIVQHYCLYSPQAIVDSVGETTRSDQNEPLLPAVESSVANECREEELQDQEGTLSEPTQPQTVFV